MPAEPTIKKRRRTRKKKSNVVQIPYYASVPASQLKSQEEAEEEKNTEVEYVVENDIESLNNPEYSEYAAIFKKFNPFEKEEENQEENVEEETKEQEKEEEDENEKNKQSKKQKKKDKKDKIEVLKLLSDRPDVVEIHDVNSAHPWLLVFLKAYRNTIMVPRHWSQRRKYLQGKRGIEKPPFELPEFIRRTGISDVRQSVLEKEESQKLKQKARERVQPKMGHLDIDYQVLYDAFFIYQTKPRLTGHGDLYYEGKEFEVDVKERKPGHLSKELRIALGMPEEGVYPPPWLTNMQHFGPPPAYPHLKIPGLNAPLPAGTKSLGWGQIPVDESGRPLYGDWDQSAVSEYTEPVERELWGELEDVEDSDDEMDVQDQAISAVDNASDAYLADPSGTLSVSGYETPDAINLRKDKVSTSASNRPLFQELQQQDASVGNAIYGSQHRYVVPNAAERVDLIRSQRSDKLDISLDPNEMETEGITEDLIRKKYEEKVQTQKNAHKSEDFSDLVEAKRKQQQQKGKKKEKFRF